MPVASSTDLRHWSPPTDALPQLPTWAGWGRTWAPGITLLGGRYLLYFAAHHESSGRQCIGVATSARADGAFVSQATGPLVCHTELGGSIDLHPFIDPNGALFLFWKADGNAIGQPSTLFAQPLSPDGLALTGPARRAIALGRGVETAPHREPRTDRHRPFIRAAVLGRWWESAGAPSPAEMRHR